MTSIYDRLRAAGLISTSDPPPRTNVRGLTQRMTAGEVGDYAAAALKGECDNVLGAGEGTRNDTLNRAAWKLGRLVEDGHLDAGTVVDALTSAARATGLPDREIAQTVGRAVSDGQVKRYEPATTTLPDPIIQEVSADSLRPATAAAVEVKEDDAADAWARAIEAEALKLRLREEAKYYEQARKAGTLTIPVPTRLDNFLADPDEPVTYRINDLMPTEAHVMLAAQFKAGKTTAIGNLIRSLVDGDKFMDHFDVVEPVKSVVLVDDEMSERQLRMWLREQGIRNTTAVHVISLRGGVASFDLVNESVRRRWVEAVNGVGCDLLIFDCLRPVLDALGLSEDKEAGRFLVAFDAMLGEAGIKEAVMVHHMGHGGERSRGDSRLRDWPDVEWRLVRDVQVGEEDPAADRFFTAFGRDVAVAEGRVGMDESRHLTFEPDMTRKESRQQRAETAYPEAFPIVRDLLRERPGAIRHVIIAALHRAGWPEKKADRELVTLVQTGAVEERPGPSRSKMHYLPEHEKQLAPN